MFGLFLSAELDGITGLRPTDTPENPYGYTFTVRCTDCGEHHPNDVSFTRFDNNPIPGGRGEANFVWKCRLCGHTHSATLTTEPTAFNAVVESKTQRVISFDCRGLEFVAFKPEGDWEALGTESGTPFTGIDLSEGEWYDYDEKAGAEVSAREVSWEIKRV